jgi:hypothetical protein
VRCEAPMDKATEYRRKAEYCRHMGESAFCEEHRTEWLRWPNPGYE